MLRRLAQLVTAVLAGAAVSQAVALLCYYRAVNYTLGSTPLSTSDLHLPDFIRLHWPPPTSGNTAASTTVGRTSTTLHCPAPATPARFFATPEPCPAEYGLYIEAYGWPARSVMSCRPCVFTTGGNGDHMDIRTIFADFNARAGLNLGVDRPWPPVNKATNLPVPVAPIWTGLALNTLLYGSIAWLLLLAPSRVRRAYRSRCGRCLTCGYDLRGLTTCPECGRKAIGNRE